MEVYKKNSFFPSDLPFFGKILLGKRRLVLPILVNEGLSEVFFRSGTYISNNHFAKLSFSHIKYISTSSKGIPCSTCHLATLRKR